jgi:hypothetical protein
MPHRHNPLVGHETIAEVIHPIKHHKTHDPQNRNQKSPTSPNQHVPLLAKHTPAVNKKRIRDDGDAGNRANLAFSLLPSKILP